MTGHGAPVPHGPAEELLAGFVRAPLAEQASHEQAAVVRWPWLAGDQGRLVRVAAYLWIGQPVPERYIVPAVPKATPHANQHVLSPLCWG